MNARHPHSGSASRETASSGFAAVDLVIGAAMMSDAERSLSKDFAEVICEELFGVDLQGRKRQSKEEGPRGSTGIGLGKSCSDSRPLYGLTACN